MTLPNELRTDHTDLLRPDGDAAAEIAAADVAVQRRGRRSLPRRVGRALLGRRLASRLRRLLLEPSELAQDAIRRTDALQQAFQEEVQVLRGRTHDMDSTREGVRAATINLELLKGEVRSVIATLEELGMAIAPGAGLIGAQARLSELRERVNGLDRRLRTLLETADGPAPAAGGAPDAGRAQEAGWRPASALFDYVGFEQRFRGDASVINAELSRRYLDRLAASPPVVDLGCGGGGVLELLAARGVQAVGVDTDPSMVAEARARGLDVRLMDGATFLRGQAPGSLGAIIATHVAEHLELGVLVELLELAATRLRPGGLFIAETPNPASLIVLGNSYVLDPTHVRPLHPSLFTFLCEGAGFRDVRLEFYAPATAYHLPLIEDPGAPAWTGQINEAFQKLNHVLFGPQEYAVIATAAPPHGA
jgi:SAM-dependent methyltransferase